MYRRPASEAWLRQPAWIDGGVEPPQFYVSHEEINETLVAYGLPPLPLPRGAPAMNNIRRAGPSIQVRAPTSPAAPPHLPPSHLTGVFGPARADSVALDPHVHGAGHALPAEEAPHGDMQAFNNAPPVDVARPTNAALPVDAAPVPAAANDDANTAQPINEPVGAVTGPVEDLYPVSVGISYMRASSAKPASRGKPAPMAKMDVNKVTHIALNETTTRSDFIRACLKVHGLDKKYALDTDLGPRFRFSWKGSAGGRSRAAAIDTDENWRATLPGALRKKADILVEFDLKDLQAAKAMQHPIGEDEEGDYELLCGTQVPAVEQFSEADQLHGAIILKLKKQWKCMDHSGEHGEDGYCYVIKDTDGAASNVHYALNPRRLRDWAAGIAAHKDTLYMPPASILDGGPRNVQGPDGAKPRGRTGPRPPPLGAASPAVDPSTLMATAMVPLALMAMERMSGMMGSGANQVTGAAGAPANGVPAYPRPRPGQELRYCLVALHDTKGIDLLAAEGKLAEHDFTPDVIPDVPVAQLAALLGVTEGKVLKLRQFCVQWLAQMN